MYDYGARFYMPDIGRWGTQDLLTETSRRFSPYTYVNNNPIFFTDPTGMLTDGCPGGKCPEGVTDIKTLPRRYPCFKLDCIESSAIQRLRRDF